ncbi:bifunctional diguanylate cyclase/phosphodiesterase [uncultured Cohaesibacter sp.]|uniref:putative bifunctional diguanylate cyclase/phosphodiesterase n=1 Tax=uncultured Cohaesibacter sp. TaxID=1002546 RepID=UPI00292F1A19|nr:bifunctional diguanylate cyclase/phosphodiesterase [uncultured Cohaesibacter sp.]
MIGFLAKYDRLFSKEIIALAVLLLANFICAVIVSLLFKDQDAETKSMIQLASIAIISMLSCIVLLQMNNSRVAAVQAMGTLVQRDKLTNLASREVFQKNLAKHLSKCDENDPFILLMVDLDRFKELNAFLGYNAADLILQQFAERLSQLAETEEFAARIGGDEFALIIPYDGTKASLQARIRDLFETIYKTYMCNKQSVELTVSTGVTLFPDDGRDPEGLSQNAYFALQRAKKEGHNRLCCYDEVADPKMMDYHFLSQDMDRALQDGEFLLYYQPQFSFETGEQTGFEALIRWNHRDRGIIPPSVFIPIAEQNGLILPLSEFVLRSACETASKWGNSRLKVAVNLSPIQMRQCQIADQVAEILLETNLEPRRLELEVTESLFIDINDSISSDLAHLQRQGISIALDDFGTGYSSLAYLTSFPFDKIKIDRSFVEHLATDDSSMAIISAVIGMGKSLNMRITAEGIEDQQCYDILRLAGCDEAQGYLLGKPRDLDVEPVEASEKIERRISAVA